MCELISILAPIFFAVLLASLYLIYFVSPAIQSIKQARLSG